MLYASPIAYKGLRLQFTEYLHLYGGANNFDGSFLGGTHNAKGNNSVFAYAWVAFWARRVRIDRGQGGP